MNTLSSIGLDIDGVLADFRTTWHKLYPEIPPNPHSYHFDDEILERYELMKKAGTLDDFFLSLKPLIKPEDIPFEPKCYITARPVESKISEQWLDKIGFPKKKVFTVPCGTSKVSVANDADIEIFIDDYYKNFKELNEAGIFTYLYTARSNLKYDVGDMRLNSLKELPLLTQLFN